MHGSFPHPVILVESKITKLGWWFVKKKTKKNFGQLFPHRLFEGCRQCGKIKDYACMQEHRGVGDLSLRYPILKIGRIVG